MSANFDAFPEFFKSLEGKDAETTSTEIIEKIKLWRSTSTGRLDYLELQKALKEIFKFLEDHFFINHRSYIIFMETLLSKYLQSLQSSVFWSPQPARSATEIEVLLFDSALDLDTKIEIDADLKNKIVWALIQDFGESKNQKVVIDLILNHGARLTLKQLEALKLKDKKILFIYRALINDTSDLVCVPVWPTQLFHATEPSSCVISPAQTVNPIAAYRGALPFQGQTFPSQQLRQKKLILTRESQGDLSDNEFFALIGALISQNFEIIYKYQPHFGETASAELFQKIIPPLTRKHWEVLFSENLGIFEPDFDFEYLIRTPKFTDFSQDNVHILTRKDLEDLRRGLSQDYYFLDKEPKSQIGSIYSALYSTEMGDLLAYTNTFAEKSEPPIGLWLFLDNRAQEIIRSRMSQKYASTENTIASYIESSMLQPSESKEARDLESLGKFFLGQHSFLGKEFKKEALPLSVTMGCFAIRDKRHTFKYMPSILILKLVPLTEFTFHIKDFDPSALLREVKKKFPNAVKVILPDIPKLQAYIEKEGSSLGLLIEWFTADTDSMVPDYEEAEYESAIRGVEGLPAAQLTTTVSFDIRAQARSAVEILPKKADSTPETYYLHTAAKYLSGFPLKQLRTGVFEFNPKDEDLHAAQVNQETGSVISNPQKPFASFASFAAFGSLEELESRYAFEIPETTLFDGEVLRLSSLSPKENICFTHALPDGIILFRGSDDFFYLKNISAKTQIFKASYQLQAVTLRDAASSTFPADDPASILLNFIQRIYKADSKFKEGVSSLAPLPNFENWAQYQQACFDERAGTCLIRSWCVYEEIKKRFPEIAQHVRVISINNNHAALEIYSSGLARWIPVDLGGGNDSTIVHLPEKAATLSSKKLEAGPFEGVTASAGDKAFLLFSPEAQPFAKVMTTIAGKSLPDGGPFAGVMASAGYSTSFKQAIEKAPFEDSTRLLYRTILQSLFQESSPSLFDFDALEDASEASRTLPVLFETPDEKSALKLLQAFREASDKKGEKIFYLHSPDQLCLYQERLLLSESSQLNTQRGDELGRFLEEVSSAGCPATLVIYWKNFSPKSRVTLNDLLAKNPQDRTLQGIKLPPQIKIVSFSSRLSQEDSAFRSRHEICTPIFSRLSQAASGSSESKSESKFDESDPGQDPETLTIDLQAKPHWQEEIFGRIVLEGSLPTWKKSPWLASHKDSPGDKEEPTGAYEEKGLEDPEAERVTPELQRPIKIKLKNISPESLSEIKDFIAQSRALGYFSYQGYHIPTDQLEFELETSGLSFTESQALFQDQITLIPQAKWSTLPIPKPILLNTYLFDYALVRPTIQEDGSYFEGPGYLESHQNSELHLFITSNLSQGQWLCLCHQAQKFNVKLTLFLAVGVEIPAELSAPAKADSSETGVSESKGSGSSESSESADKSAEEEGAVSKIYLSSTPEIALQKLLALVMERSGSAEKPWVIDVEDFSYEDLVESRTCQVSKKGPAGLPEFKVSVQVSAVMEAVKAGQRVILKGEFSDGLLQVMQPLLLNPAYESLTLLVETKAGGSSDTRFAYHPNTPERLDFPVALASPLSFTPEVLHEVVNAEDSAEVYISKRKSLLINMLIRNPALQLIGPPGVGKSSLIRELEKEHQARLRAGETPAFQIYREIKNLEAWAKDTDTSTGLKILFIDEANLDNKHLTQFADLLRGGREILIKNSEGHSERITLSEQHKIIFAANPITAGGERRAQKLFQIFTPPEIHLQNFSQNYLIEKLLGPILGLPLPIPATEEPIKTWLNDYYLSGLNIRGLQEKALAWQLEHSERPSMGAGMSAGGARGSSEIFGLKTPDFLLTENLLEIHAQLSQFVEIRQAQSLGILSPDTQGLGLGGVFIQGRPGFGKTELIRAVLSQYHYDPISSLSPEEYPGNFYDKIEAGIPLEEKKARLLKAFENGWAVWIDEYDACTDGLEKFMNVLMTGQHPETGEKAKKPGFMVLATGNGAAMSGRKKLSSASESRFLHFDMPNYGHHDLEAVIRHHRPDFPPELVKDIALKFERSKKTQPWLNLRDLVNQISDHRVTLKFQSHGPES